MYRQFYDHMRFSDLPLFAMLLFITTFAVVVVRFTVFKKRNDFERISRLPLDD